MKNTLCIASLSWRKSGTLKKSLETYKSGGLLDYADEKLVFFNEFTDVDISVANDYGIHAIGTTTNIGIGASLKQLALHAKSKYIIFLENDFTLVEQDSIALRNHLNMCKALIRSEKAHVIKLRHRTNPGNPLYSRGLIQKDRYLSMVHWADLNNLPCEVKSFENKKYGIKYWQSTAENSNYTNNPSMYNREWFMDKITPFCNKGGVALEGDIQPIWATWKDVNVIQTDGLFCHNP